MNRLDMHLTLCILLSMLLCTGSTKGPSKSLSTFEDTSVNTSNKHPNPIGRVKNKGLSSQKPKVLSQKQHENVKQELEDFNNAKVLESAILAVFRGDQEHFETKDDTHHE